MGKFENIGNGYVKHGQQLLNLITSIKSIRKHTFGLGENPDGNEYSIVFVPINPTREDVESGGDGTYHITYSTMAERNEDFEILEQTIKDSGKKLTN